MNLFGYMTYPFTHTSRQDDYDLWSELVKSKRFSWDHIHMIFQQVNWHLAVRDKANMETGGEVILLIWQPHLCPPLVRYAPELKVVTCGLKVFRRGRLQVHR